MNHYHVRMVPKCGVYLTEPTWTELNDSVLVRNHADHGVDIERVSQRSELVQAAASVPGGFYAGFLIQHYGHFLLESLARLHALKSSGHNRVYWVNLTGAATEFKSWQRQILKLLGVDGFEHTIVNHPLDVGSLYVVPPGYRIRDLITPAHAEFLAKVRAEPTGKKIWVSRRSEVEGIAWSNEQLVEQQLQERGWEILNPVDHSIEDQVKVLAGARSLAGTVGSAFHTLLLAEHIHAEVHLFSRGTSKTINKNFATIANSRGFRQREHFPRQQRESVSASKAAKFLVNVQDVVEALSHVN